MFWSLLESTGNTTTEQPANSWMMYIVLGVVIVIFIVWMVFSGRVKTAGGICGIVVEVCDDNTVILETGSETAGKSYVKMDKELIAQTDAKGPTQIAREEAEARRKAEEAEKKAKKSGEVPAPAPAHEEPAAEEKSEPAEEEEEK